MNKETIKLFDEIVVKAKENVNSEGGLLPVVILVKKDGKMEIIGMRFGSSSEKEIIRQLIKNKIASTEIKFYMVVMDCKMTTMGKVPEVEEALVVGLFSPKDMILKLMPYKDKIFSTNEIIQTERSDARSEWDLWSSIEVNEKVGKAYDKFKNANPEKYGGMR